MRDLVTLRENEALELRGPVTVEREYTDGKVTALWLTDGIARYLVQGVFSGWLEVYQPREQAAGTLGACPAIASKPEHSVD